MQFTQRDGVWVLLDSPEGGRVIAPLRNEVEAAALAGFCRHTLAAPDRVPEHFAISHLGRTYAVTPLGSPGERLALVITDTDYSSTVQTEFTMPAVGV